MLHLLAAVLLESGEDPRFHHARILVHASEDVGLADPLECSRLRPQRMPEWVGMPEARIPMAQAVLAIANALNPTLWSRRSAMAVQYVKNK
jgi:putative ATPase